jgi:fatty acid desaturase
VKLFPVWYVVVLAALFISSRQSALGNLGHDAWHCLCFRPRNLNDWVGAWLYNYPIGIPFHHDRERHRRHHRRVGHDDDPELPSYTNEGRETPLRIVCFFLGRLCGSMLLATLRSLLLNRQAKIHVAGDGTAARLSVLREYLCITLVQLALLFACWLYVDWWAYWLLWLLPLVTMTITCINLRGFLEHATTHENGLPNQRLMDFTPPLIEQLFLSPCHFHYHALHHHYPSVPHYRLPLTKQKITTALGNYPFRVLPGYVWAFARHMSELSWRATGWRAAGFSPVVPPAPVATGAHGESR